MQEKVDVIALSVDSMDKAKETVEQLKLTFPVAYGLEVPREQRRSAPSAKKGERSSMPRTLFWIRTKKWWMHLIASARSDGSLPLTL